jgi:hypothetical protein
MPRKRRTNLQRELLFVQAPGHAEGGGDEGDLLGLVGGLLQREHPLLLRQLGPVLLRLRASHLRGDERREREGGGGGGGGGGAIMVVCVHTSAS